MPQLPAIAKPEPIAVPYSTAVPYDVAVAAYRTDPNIVKWIIYLNYRDEQKEQEITALNAQIVSLKQQVLVLQTEEKKMDAAVTQVQADFTTLKTDVSAKLTDFQTQLAAALNNPSLPADTKAALVALDADMTAFDATVKATGTTPPTP